MIRHRILVMNVAMIVAIMFPHLGLHAAERTDANSPASTVASINVRRSNANPLIDYNSSPSLGNNINGPSVIRVPLWIKNPLGKYYMYFGHHNGKFIRLAYADSLRGPWRIYEPGTLSLDQAKNFREHIASPDVHVDEQKQEIRMYFHGPTQKGAQKTGVATSKDGLSFTASEDILGEYYFRVFKWKEYYYAIAKDGNTNWGMLYRSKDGVSLFESRKHFIKMIRHAAILVEGDQLLVFFSRVGDSPERIVVSTVTLTDDWKQWRESETIDVILPEKYYEGISYPDAPSKYGSAVDVRQLRDPCIFKENGHTYLFYSIAGEMGIALAELDIKMTRRNRHD